MVGIGGGADSRRQGTRRPTRPGTPASGPSTARSPYSTTGTPQATVIIDMERWRGIAEVFNRWQVLAAWPGLNCTLGAEARQPGRDTVSALSKSRCSTVAEKWSSTPGLRV